MTETEVQSAIVKYLRRLGYSRDAQVKGLRQQGVDINVKHRTTSRDWYVETKGESQAVNSRQVSENSFLNSLGQIITRMTIRGSYKRYYGLGLPSRTAEIACRRIPWQVAQKLNLHIFAVDQDLKVRKYSSKNLKRIQAERKRKLNAKKRTAKAV